MEFNIKGIFKQLIQKIEGQMVFIKFLSMKH